MSRYNGTLGESGSVGWQFERKGIIIVDRSEVKNEEEFMLNMIDNGAEDIDEDDDVYEIKTPPSEFMKVKNALEKSKINVKSSELGLVPKSTIKLSKEDGAKALKLINALDEHDDVQNVTSNLEISDEILSEV